MFLAVLESPTLLLVKHFQGKEFPFFQQELGTEIVKAKKCSKNSQTVNFSSGLSSSKVYWCMHGRNKLEHKCDTKLAKSRIS